MQTALDNSRSPSSPIPLFRLLGDAGRLKLMALIQHEDFTVSELAFLLEESQPQISKKIAALKRAELIRQYKDGTRTFQKSVWGKNKVKDPVICLLYTSPSPRDRTRSRMPSSA